MEDIAHQVINYLNIRSNITIVSFPNDGLPQLTEILKERTSNPKSYDFSYLFVPISFLFLKQLSLEGLESEIDKSLQINFNDFENIIDSLKKGFELVVIADDLDLVTEISKAADSADALIKKYQGKVRVVYLLESPQIVLRLKNEVMSYSTVFDAIIYHKTGSNWSKEELTKRCVTQFKKELDESEIDEISSKSNNHFGIFKKLYQDKILSTDNTEVYIDSLLNDFKTEEISTLKKILSKRSLDDKESKIKKALADVNFIDSDNNITIPIIAERILSFRISGKIDLDSKDLKLSGIDLDLLTRTERVIIEELLKLEEVTKEEIAKIIWGDKIDELYSEWAIDQRMSRLKRKLMDLGFNIDIKTLYGRGYKLIKL